MQRQFYGIGVNFGKSSKGYFTPSADKKLIRDSIYSILMTKPGERVHLPRYGVGLELYVFEQNDQVLVDILKTNIIEQINTYEPGVDVLEINFDNDENTLKIQLIVRMKDFNGDVDTFNYSLRG